MEVADQTGEGGKHLSHKARSFSPCDRLICSVCFHLPWRGARNVNCMNEGQIFHFPGWPSTWRLHCKCKLKPGDHESVCIYIHAIWMAAVAICFNANKAAVSILLSHLLCARWWPDQSTQVTFILVHLHYLFLFSEIRHLRRELPLTVKPLSLSSLSIQYYCYLY